MELSVHVIQLRTESRLVADRCPQRLAPDRPPKAHIPHQPRHRAASGAEALPPQLTPNLTHAIDTKVLLEHAPDLDLQIGVSADPVGQTGRIGSPGEMGAISRRGDRQNPADRRTARRRFGSRCTNANAAPNQPSCCQTDSNWTRLSPSPSRQTTAVSAPLDCHPHRLRRQKALPFIEAHLSSRRVASG